ncbi:MAG: tetratricopeptide repeat protein [Phycisphaerales bacterium]|nr:tetratricopeptide repeat protein [Phycisphaerales bacterium]
MSEHQPSLERRPVLTPRLRWLLRVVLFGFGLMMVNSLCLLAWTFMEWRTGRAAENLFTIWVFLMHVCLGLLLVVPIVVYGIAHMLRARHSPNINARRVGYALFGSALLLLLSGVVLLRIEGVPNPFDSGDDRDVVWWIHVALPFVGIWLFIAHRMVGPRLRWGVGIRWTMATVLLTVVIIVGQFSSWSGAAERNVDGEAFWQPAAMSRIAGGHPEIPIADLTAIEGCIECHPDAHSGWSASAHRFSSFDNPVYAAAVRATRSHDPAMSTFCAGCHDPVLLLSGTFDDPRLDDPDLDPATVPGATAGVNCLVCHSISAVDPFGNGSWTMEPPSRYPFHDAKSAPLRWLHRQLIRSRPGFHKVSMNRPGVTDSALLCGTCHKAWIPEELNDYRWLHGQDHYDSWRNSGVSGHGVHSWRWPEHPSTDCNACHMPLRPSEDMAARDRDGSGIATVHDHLMPGGNTALPVLLDLPGKTEILAAHEEILRESMRVDIIGLREGGVIDGAFIGPLRPELPDLEPGGDYLLEIVARNLGTGHAFTQGTADSNEIWLDVTVRSGERLIGRSGAIDEEGVVDPWAYRLNAFVVDGEGHRVETRAPERIFASVYDHQVPPGAASVTHYRLEVPEDIDAPIEIDVSIRYRKFDHALMTHVFGASEGGRAVRSLPIPVVARDTVTLPVRSGTAEVTPQSAPAADWERLYDYGIGLHRLGPRGPLRQAEEAFRRVAELGRDEGYFGLGRTYLRQGRYEEAVDMLTRASREGSTVPPWGVAYLSGVTDLERGLLEEARAMFRSLADEQATAFPEATRRGFDFSGDDRLQLDIVSTVLRMNPSVARDALTRALDRCDLVLGRNPQDFRAWWLRSRVLDAIGNDLPVLDVLPNVAGLEMFEPPTTAVRPGDPGRAYHDRFRPDAQAREHAIREARKRYPWADRAAEPTAIYELKSMESTRD